jgi:zinc transporter ZupT
MSEMTVSRKLGTLVFFAVPAIVGGGITYWLSDSFTIMWVYEILLLVLAGAIISK